MLDLHDSDGVLTSIGVPMKYIAFFCSFISLAAFADATSTSCELQKKILQDHLMESFGGAKLKHVSSELSASVTPTVIFYISNSKSMKQEGRALDALIIEYEKKFPKAESFVRREINGSKPESSFIYYANKEREVELTSEVLQVSHEKKVSNVNPTLLPRIDREKVVGLGLIRETKLSKGEGHFYVKTYAQGEKGIYSKTVTVEHYLKKLLPAECAAGLADGKVVISISDGDRGISKETPRSQSVVNKKKSSATEQ